jgi:four helix bundle protein
MASAKSFEDLEVWQKATDLALRVYGLTLHPTFNRDFALRDQIRKSAVSVSSNIAEGFEYGNNKDFIRFLKYAKGSAGELRSQLYIARKLNYLEEPEFDQLQKEQLHLSRQISSLIRYLQQHI